MTRLFPMFTHSKRVPCFTLLKWFILISGNSPSPFRTVSKESERGNETPPYSSHVPWHPHLRMDDIPSHVLRLLTYNCCTESIITIQTNDLYEAHFSVPQGLSFLCLCNMSLSQDRKDKFFKNPKLSCRHWNQRMNVYYGNYSTAFVTISSPTKLLTLMEIAKIEFLKENRMLYLKHPKKLFPIPIRNLYCTAVILNVKFFRCTVGRTQRIFRSDPDCWDMNPQKYYPKRGSTTVRSCIKNCIKNGILVKTSECYYAGGNRIYFSYKDWFCKYWLKNECHERSELVTMHHENINLPLIYTKFPQ